MGRSWQVVSDLDAMASQLLAKILLSGLDPSRLAKKQNGRLLLRVCR